MYTTYTYLILFLGVVFLVYTVLPKKFKWVALLTSSYIFYAAQSGKLTFFLVLSTLSVYLGALAVDKIQSKFDAIRKSLEKEERKKRKLSVQRKKKAVVALIIIINFGILAFLKYANFAAESFVSLAAHFGKEIEFEPLKLVLPLGISFYTLQAVSYVIDVYRGKYKATKNLAKVALFLSFFPHITEGPIGRFDVIADNIYEGHKFNYENVTFALQLIFWGLFKKIVIADRANTFVKTVFEDYKMYNGAVIVIAVLLYTLQLYSEFSGCMDIVRGSAGLFGVELQKNFDRPFFSKSVNEFWRRWHITLGAWLRDYVFYSVSLSKPFMSLSRSAKKHMNAHFANVIPAAFALFFVWLGNGIWHGAAWKYIAYGLYYYVIMLIGMLFEPLIAAFFTKTHINRDGKVLSALKVLRTFVFVNIGMLMFRAKGLKAFLRMFLSIFEGSFLIGVKGGELFNYGIDEKDFIVLIVGFFVMLVISILQERGHSIRAELAKKPLPLRWAIYIALIAAIVIFGAYGQNYGKVDFIYGQF
ncbi:MAG: MBOAT family O-acyltransferase [Oscillospiraceae bacterium]|nr:MBOAT family O-acyltransferase [Oscillospiraceae bacterium]